MPIIVRAPRPARKIHKTAADSASYGPVRELTDLQWAGVSPLLPPGRSTGRQRTTDLRRVVTAIHHHWATGCPWRRLPPDLSWSTIYTYYRNWVKDGTARKLRAVLNPPKLSEVAPTVRKPAKAPSARLDPDRGSSAVLTAPRGVRIIGSTFVSNR